MRVVRIEGRDLELVRSLLVAMLADGHGDLLEVGFDSRGVSFRMSNKHEATGWTPQYGAPVPSQRAR